MSSTDAAVRLPRPITAFHRDAEPSRDDRVFRIVRAAILGLFVLGLVALIAGPARGMRSDIARQRQLISTQLATTRAQLEATNQQLDITRRQLDLTTEQQRISAETLDLVRQQLTLAQQQLGRTDESLALQRQLLTIAQQTLDQARQINQKTPDTTPVPSAPVSVVR